MWHHRKMDHVVSVLLTCLLKTARGAFFVIFECRIPNVEGGLEQTNGDNTWCCLLLLLIGPINIPLRLQISSCELQLGFVFIFVSQVMIWLAKPSGRILVFLKIWVQFSRVCVSTWLIRTTVIVIWTTFRENVSVKRLQHLNCPRQSTKCFCHWRDKSCFNFLFL